MQTIFHTSLLLLVSFSAFYKPLVATPSEERKKMEMIQDLEVIKHNFEAGYAPTQWKKDHNGWDLDKAFEISKNRVLATPQITTKQFQGIVRDFFNSMNDYHVDVLFHSTESASLPFTIKSIGQQAFIQWVDSVRLPYSKYGIKAGDELLEFNEQPVMDALKELRLGTDKFSNPQTDQSLADIKLTLRTGREGDCVPNGAIVVKIKSAASGKINSYQLRWTYHPEYISSPLDFIQCIGNLVQNRKSVRQQFESLQSEFMMASPLHTLNMTESMLHDGGLGGRKSFVPTLGTILWEIDQSQSGKGRKKSLVNDDPSWYAYIYEHPDDGSPIGFLRIPHYTNSNLQELEEIIAFMEQHTDALVIDQLNNIGGSARNLYAIASMLTAKPLVTPLHRIKITQKEALKSHKTIEWIKILEELMQYDLSDEEEEEDDDGKVDYQQLLFFKAYHERILKDWTDGQVLTHPTHLLGIDWVNPNPHYNYSKPLLVLINELDFSAGDFLPAILQDNKRAILFGARTAGAGGFVRSFEFPNNHGIDLCSYTASIAERPNFEKIENLGVKPDIGYQLTVEDLTEGYRPYANAVNRAVLNLIK